MLLHTWYRGFSVFVTFFFFLHEKRKEGLPFSPLSEGVDCPISLSLLFSTLKKRLFPLAYCYSVALRDVFFFPFPLFAARENRVFFPPQIMGGTPCRGISPKEFCVPFFKRRKSLYSLFQVVKNHTRQRED